MQCRLFGAQKLKLCKKKTLSNLSSRCSEAYRAVKRFQGKGRKAGEGSLETGNREKAKLQLWLRPSLESMAAHNDESGG